MITLRSDFRTVRDAVPFAFGPNRRRGGRRAHPRLRRRMRLLLLLSLLTSAAFASLLSLAPPLDGDVYEYAEVAANLVEHSAALEDHARYPIFAHQPLPHPAGRRMNAYAVALVPFYWVFGRSASTVTVPFLCAYAALPFVVHRFARRFFGSRAALWGAVLLALHPRVIYIFGFDPMPDLLLTELLLLALCAASQGRRWGFGITFGIACALRETSLLLLPAMLITAVIDPRRRVPMRRAATGLLVAVGLVAPYLIRNWVTFRTPFPLEEFGAVRMSSELYGSRGFDLLRVGFDWRGPPPAAAAPGLLARFEVLIHNLQAGLGGRFSGFDFYPGFPEMLGVPLFGLLLLRLLRTGTALRPSLPFAFLLVYLPLHLLFMIHEDRYFLPVLPIATLLALEAAARLSRAAGWRLFKPASLVALVLATESAPMLAMKAIEIGSGRAREADRELADLSSWIAQHTAPGSRFLAFPFFSASFFTARPTIPLPYVDLSSLGEAIRALRIQHLLLLREPEVVREPSSLLPCVSRAVGGRWFDLFTVDTACLARPESADLKDFDVSYNPLAARIAFAWCRPPLGRSLAAVCVHSIGFGRGLAVYSVVVVPLLVAASWVVERRTRLVLLTLGPWIWLGSTWLAPRLLTAVGLSTLLVWSSVRWRSPEAKRHRVVALLAAAVVAASLGWWTSASAVQARRAKSGCVQGADSSQVRSGVGRERAGDG